RRHTIFSRDWSSDVCSSDLKAHRALESITLDREQIRIKDALVPEYATLVYRGFWFSPERESLQALIDQTQRVVTGTVRLKLYKRSEERRGGKERRRRGAPRG